MTTQYGGSVAITQNPCRGGGFGAPALHVFYGEPVRALSCNAAVIAAGFTPLFLSTLVPYVVVGAFLASILLLSWLSTVLALPALVSLQQPKLCFRNGRL
jgi:hypothetical protein